jgi:hypothetical protein
MVAGRESEHGCIVPSNSPKVEHAAAALPPDLLIPYVANIPQHLQEGAREQIDENLQDQEEKEHLPEDTPESEDIEEEENGRNEEDGMELAPLLQTLLLIHWILWADCL